MKLIIEVTPHNGEKYKTHHIIKDFPIIIGRGFNSNIIISDPFIDAKHIEISYNEDIYSFKDLDSTNGVIVNSCENKDSISSGDVITIGNTRVKFYLEGHPVAETLKLKDLHPIFSLLSKPINAWIFALIAFLLLQLWSFLEIWTDERSMAVAGTAAIGLAIIVIWSAIWSAASRLIINKANFIKHMAIISIYIIASIIFWYLESYVKFLSNSEIISNIINYGINFIVLSLLIYGSLNFASLMRETRRFIVSVFFSFGVTCGIFLLSIVSKQSFIQNPQYHYNIEPFLSQLAPTDSFDQFMLKNKKLFKLKEISKSKD